MRKILLTLGMAWFGVSGCGDTYEYTIPNVSFSFTCNLAQNPYYKITTPGQFLVVSKNVNGLPVGYGGLILGQSVFSDGQTYLAFDAACPVEASRQIILQLENDGIGTAVCPKCHATFGLSAGGSRNDGKGEEYLRPYRVRIAGKTLQVSN